MKILLFGRTGSGKSTVANMLIRGNLKPPVLFCTSSGMRGMTMDTQRETMGDRVVVDTVGFCEGEGGSAPHHEARAKLYDYFMKTDEGFNYYAYVHKGPKIDALDVKLWEFFKEAFKGVEDNFVVVCTHVGPEYLVKDGDYVKATFGGCQRCMCVDFPEEDLDIDDDPELQEMEDMKRQLSLERMERELAMFVPPLLTPTIRRTMNKGRVLLLGWNFKILEMIENLLVNGSDLDLKSSMTSLSSSYGIADSYGIVDSEGRGWCVVKCFLTSHYLSLYSTSRAIAFKIMHALKHGSYSHIMYIVDGGGNIEVDKRVWKIVKALLNGVEDNLVVLVLNVDWSIDLQAKDGKATKLAKKFKDCRCTLYLDFPYRWYVDKAYVGKIEAKEMRKKFLACLEAALCSTTTKRVQIQAMGIEMEDRFLTYISHLLAPIPVKYGPGRFRVVWLPMGDSLSHLSKMYGNVFQNAPTNLAKNIETTQIVVGFCSIIGVRISHAPVQSINVELTKLKDHTFNKSFWCRLSIKDENYNLKGGPFLLRYTKEDHAERQRILWRRDVCRTNLDDTSFLDQIQKGDMLYFETDYGASYLSMKVTC